ncbi:MAG: hypothetical protein WD312_01890 [Candidatus Paceibacterota bacterium]
MARLGDKSKLLQILAETPIVSFACKKIGLDRTTYYRWRKDDKDFRDQTDAILEIGRQNINDMAESAVIKGIKNENARLIIFWLQYNNPRYKPVRTTYVDPVTHPHKLESGETCRVCGYKEPNIEKYRGRKKQKISKEDLVHELSKRIKELGTKERTSEEVRHIINDFFDQFYDVKDKLKIDGAKEVADNLQKLLDRKKIRRNKR